MRMLSSVLAGLAASALLMGGCSRPQGSNDIASGSLHEVTQASEGMGRGQAREAILDMGIMPLDGWIQPDIPLIRNAQTIAIWFYPAKSADNRTIRDGFWAHHVIRDFSWGVDEAMHERAVTLNALSGMSIDAEGNLVIDPRRIPNNLPSTVPRPAPAPSIDGNPKLLPHIRSGGGAGGGAATPSASGSGSAMGGGDDGRRVRVFDADRGEFVYDSHGGSNRAAEMANEFREMGDRLQRELTTQQGTLDDDAFRRFMEALGDDFQFEP